jgi:hypothetical protein
MLKYVVVLLEGVYDFQVTIRKQEKDSHTSAAVIFHPSFTGAM